MHTCDEISRTSCSRQLSRISFLDTRRVEARAGAESREGAPGQDEVGRGQTDEPGRQRLPPHASDQQDTHVLWRNSEQSVLVCGPTNHFGDTLGFGALRRLRWGCVSANVTSAVSDTSRAQPAASPPGSALRVQKIIARAHACMHAMSGER